MGKLAGLICLLLFGNLAVAADGSNSKTSRSAHDTVAQYLRMAEEGQLLTADGWNKANALFLHPVPAPKGPIRVIYHENSLHEQRIDENHTELDAPYEDLGGIDSKLRLIPPPKSSAIAVSALYRLSRTEKHWELDQSGQSRELTGPPEWRLDDSEPRWTGITGAIKYVKSMQDKTTDPELKRNAQITLGKLEVTQAKLKKLD